MARRTIEQAGGIVFRGPGAKPTVLVVSARRKRGRWVLPKGTIKRGESAMEAALREVREEAGIRGKIVGPAGSVDFNTNVGRVHVEYFLVKYTRQDDDEGEGRDTRWCAIEDALALLTYASARRVLLEAYPKLIKRAQRKAASAKRSGGDRRARG